MIKILIAEDHIILRDGLNALLREDSELKIVAEAGNCQEVLSALSETEVDILLLDINMPGKDGIEILKEVREKHGHIKCIVLSMLESEGYVLKSFDAGAKGYVLKTTGKDELIRAIKIVAAGECYISHKISYNLINSLRCATTNNLVTSIPIELTDREQEVLFLIGEGFTNGEIAERIFTSKRTVESHRKNLMEKTGTRNSASLIKFAVLNGLLS